MEAPQLSVMPQTSTIGTPSARYQRTRSGEIGAAPVTQKRARCTPISLRTLSRASLRASRNCEAQPGADRLAGEHLVGDALADRKPQA